MILPAATLAEAAHLIVHVLELEHHRPAICYPDDPRHGTARGWSAHRRAGEQACDPCKRGAAARVARYKLDRSRGTVYRYGVEGVQRRLQALVALGYTFTTIDRLMGVERTCSRWATEPGRWFTAKTHLTVCAVYDRLSMRLPDESTPRKASKARQARELARARGWAPPLAWDDDTIDDPAATPRGVSHTLDRATFLTELAAKGGGMDEALRVTEIARDTLNMWCRRHGMSEVYLALARNDRQDRSWANQYGEGGAA